MPAHQIRRIAELQYKNHLIQTNSRPMTKDQYDADPAAQSAFTSTQSPASARGIPTAPDALPGAEQRGRDIQSDQARIQAQRDRMQGVMPGSPMVAAGPGSKLVNRPGDFGGPVTPSAAAPGTTATQSTARADSDTNTNPNQGPAQPAASGTARSVAPSTTAPASPASRATPAAPASRATPAASALTPAAQAAKDRDASERARAAAAGRPYPSGDVSVAATNAARERAGLAPLAGAALDAAKRREVEASGAQISRSMSPGGTVPSSSPAAPTPAAPAPAATTPAATTPAAQNFGQAFAAARAAAAAAGNASAGRFVWQGKEYQTNIKGEPYLPRDKQIAVGAQPAAQPTTAQPTTAQPTTYTQQQLFGQEDFPSTTPTVTPPTNIGTSPSVGTQLPDETAGEALGKLTAQMPPTAPIKDTWAEKEAELQKNIPAQSNPVRTGDGSPLLSGSGAPVQSGTSGATVSDDKYSNSKQPALTELKDLVRLAGLQR